MGGGVSPPPCSNERLRSLGVGLEPAVGGAGRRAGGLDHAVGRWSVMVASDCSTPRVRWQTGVAEVPYASANGERRTVTTRLSALSARA